MKENIISKLIVIVIVLLISAGIILLYPTIKANFFTKTIKTTSSKEPEIVIPTLSLKVVDDENKPLKDVVVELYKEDMTPIKQYTTDNEGNIKIILEKENAIYHYKELSVDGRYQKDENTYDISVTDTERTFSREIKNNKFTGQLIIRTQDANEIPKGGVKYTVYNSDGSVYHKMESYPASGRCGIENIPLGDYYYMREGSDEKEEFSITYPGEVVDEAIIIE